MSWYRDEELARPRYLLDLNERIELTLETACECLRGESFHYDGRPEYLEHRPGCTFCKLGLRTTRRDPMALYALLERGNLTPAELAEVMHVTRFAAWDITWAYVPPALFGATS